MPVTTGCRSRAGLSCARRSQTDPRRILQTVPSRGDAKQQADVRRQAFYRVIKDAQAKLLIATRELNGVQLVWLVAKQRSLPYKTVQHPVLWLQRRPRMPDQQHGTVRVTRKHSKRRLRIIVRMYIRGCLSGLPKRVARPLAPTPSRQPCAARASDILRDILRDMRDRPKCHALGPPI